MNMAIWDDEIYIVPIDLFVPNDPQFDCPIEFSRSDWPAAIQVQDN